MKMTKSVKSNDLLSRNKRIQCCEKSCFAFIDVLIFTSVVIALGLLFLSFSKLLILNCFEIIRPVIDIIEEDISEAPITYTFLGLGLTCILITAVVITGCTSRRCGKPGCKGLRKAAKFDMQVETEDFIKSSDRLVENGLKKGVFQLPGDHYKELEAELKKLAPVNGRAVMVFRAKCGCSIGRMEVPGPKKLNKAKK